MQDNFGKFQTENTVAIPEKQTKDLPHQQVTDRINDDLCEVLSVEEAGRKLGLGRAAAYAHAKAGHLPVIKLGNRTLVPKAALAKLLASA
jgi:excisionase family DNA binding protein